MTRTFLRMSAALLVLSALGIFWARPAAAQIAGSTSITGIAGASAPSTGSATQQQGTIHVQLIEAGGKPYTDLQLMTEISKAECEQGTIKVSLSNVPNADVFRFLEPWLATGSGQCNMGDRAMRIPDTANCTQLELDRPQGTVNTCTGLCQNIVVKLGPTCDSDGPRSIFFLALQSENSAENAQAYGVLTITIDTLAPQPPSNLKGGSGETQIPLTWDQPPELRATYWVVLDPTASPGGSDTDGGAADCSSSYLSPGGTIDPTMMLPSALRVTHINKRVGSTTVNGDDFAGSTLAAAVVIAQDRAGNFSNLSNLACLQVTPTSGFWDRYKTNGGTAEPGCGCSVPGGGAGSQRILSSALAMLLLLGWVGRRSYRRQRTRTR